MSMNSLYTKKDVINGALVYSAGDTIASLLLNEFNLLRLLGIIFIGGLLYSLEVPNYFKWIDKKFDKEKNKLNKSIRVIMALLYFNPLWIARHIMLLSIFMGKAQELSFDIVRIASISFLWNIPVSITANFVIQNKITYKWRFLASAIFSGLMAIYYALSRVLFS